MKKNIDNCPIVTFCIPSYNYNYYTYNLIKSILTYKGKDIEIVVTDNRSTDNTLELLNSIKDERLSIYVNEKNLGAVGNFIECLKKGNGKYLYTYIARDLIYEEKIDNLVQFLKNSEYTYVNNHKSKVLIKDSTSIESLKLFAYKNWHPTGHIFKKEIIHKILKEIEKKDYFYYSIFPHDYLIVETILHGKTCVYGDSLKKEHNEDYFRNVKSKYSITEDKNEDDVWFGRKMILDETKRKLEHIIDIAENKILFNYLFRELYFSQLASISVNLKNRLKSNVMCEHYKILSRDVTFSEMKKNVSVLVELIEQNLKGKNFLSYYNLLILKLYRVEVFAYYIKSYMRREK